MTWAQIKNEIAGMSPEQQDELAAFLSQLRRQRDPQHARRMADRVADPDPKHWVKLDDFVATVDADEGKTE